ncbi:glutamyl-tRNA reductase [Lunatibacter salilacus]|uniref:glutamyl-tRNA reductase n=1 Tax=Lunatibacter salilacus TaxID=2483804 RepID=UPI00131E6B26|nr:glutamyl-tRNA reductase [Lunatibacter salilacus]
MQKFILYSLSWEQSDVKTREAFSFSNEDIVRFNDQMRSLNHVSEWMVLSTCNRTEILTYGKPSSMDEVLTQIAKAKNQLAAATSEIFQVRIEDALPYIAEVTSGLRSQILGDAQILNQVKVAYKFACQCETVGAFTHRVMQLLFAANKKIATQTDFKTGISSVPYAAIDMAKEYMEMYNDPAIAVVGFGEMSQSVCKYLISKGVANITVFNRSKEKVREFFQFRPVQWTVYSLDELENKLVDFDIVFSAATVPNYVITPSMLNKEREGFFQLLMDISLPRSVDPNVDRLEGVIRLDMDDIKEVTGASESRKQESIGTVMRILEDCVHTFENWAESHKKLKGVRELKQRLYNIDYGRLLAFYYNRTEYKDYTIKHANPDSLLIQKLIRETVLSIKNLPS